MLITWGRREGCGSSSSGDLRDGGGDDTDEGSHVEADKGLGGVNDWVKLPIAEGDIPEMT